MKTIFLLHFKTIRVKCVILFCWVASLFKFNLRNTESERFVRWFLFFSLYYNLSTLYHCSFLCIICTELLFFVVNLQSQKKIALNDDEMSNLRLKVNCVFLLFIYLYIFFNCIRKSISFGVSLIIRYMFFVLWYTIFFSSLWMFYFTCRFRFAFFF